MYKCVNVKNLLSEIGNKIQSLPVKSDDHCIKKNGAMYFKRTKNIWQKKWRRDTEQILSEGKLMSYINIVLN